MRTVVVTGANSGIGLATVLEIARRGFRSVGSVRSEAKAELVAKAAADAGVEVECVRFDVSDADGCAEAIDRLRPYGVVNNAGDAATGAIEDVSDEEARRVLEVMVVAPMRLARLAIPHMREAGGGRIVNVSSIYGRTTTPLTGWYQGAKHALEALSDALRIEVASDGVKVCLVEPGAFKSGIWEENARQVAAREGSRFESSYRRVTQVSKLYERIAGDPKRVARVIANAVSSSMPRSRYLVGADAYALSAAELIAPTAVADRIKRLIAKL
jgi:NAD(P)-dependent dehydrogenase (short-subunit alcohol dehydrogenase family)